MLIGGLCTALAAVVLLVTAAVAFAATARSAGGAAAVQADSRCNYRVYAPYVHFGILAKAQFECTPGHQNSTASIVMQNLSNGHWNTVAAKSDHLDIQAGKTYNLQTKWHPPVYHCSDQKVLQLRTYFALRLNGKLRIAYTTPAQKNYLPCT
jgi:hypothetical protein